MKKPFFIILAVLVGAGLVRGGFFLYQNLPGALPVIVPPSGDIVDILEGENATDFPLTLPDGFKIEIFAKGLPGARVMTFDTHGNMWVSQTSEGIISLLEVEDGAVRQHNPIFKNLKKPHGIVFEPGKPFLFYIAEENKISRVTAYSDDSLKKIADLPAGGGHFTRTISFGPDERLYVSIGSSCNVCDESDERRAKIFSMNSDGTDVKEFARGLRNTVFFVWHYVTGDLWGTDMGRDWLGDDTPPDEVNILKAGGNYGWPICYGKNIHDADFDKNTYIRNPCTEPFETGSHIDLQAHSAPLGFGFVPEEGWPEEYWYDMIVALHGSWNRSTPVGYKLLRIPLDAHGNMEGPAEDFIAGWLQAGSALGRPVDVLMQPGGVMYVSDDKAGVIYRITYTQETP